MKKSEVTKLLKNEGYRLVRENGKHEIWSNGEHTIPVSRGSKPKTHVSQRIKSLIRNKRQSRGQLAVHD